MPKQVHLDALEAARRLAALSPQTQARFDESMSLGWSGTEQVIQAFCAIGVAVASTREPVSDENKRKLFSLAEQLLKSASPDVSNAVATCMLEQIWDAGQTGSFDFSDVDPYLGPEARRYLLAWDAFNETKVVRSE